MTAVTREVLLAGEVTVDRLGRVWHASPAAERLRRNSITTMTGCIEYRGVRNSSGYGVVGVGGYRRVLAHRAAWMIENGDIPEGLCVLHRCDNPPCCNPDHLFLGTPADNNADRDRKGRGVYPVNEANGKAKLSSEQVQEIRDLAAAGYSYKAIARTFQVHHVTISRICRRLRRVQ